MSKCGGDLCEIAKIPGLITTKTLTLHSEAVQKLYAVVRNRLNWSGVTFVCCSYIIAGKLLAAAKNVFDSRNLTLLRAVWKDRKLIGKV